MSLRSSASSPTLATEEPQQSEALEAPSETPDMTQSTGSVASPATTNSEVPASTENNQHSDVEGRKLVGSIIAGAVIAAIIIKLIMLNRRRRRG